MSKVHLMRPGTTSLYCGMSPRAGHELRSTEDKEKFVRISKNPEAIFPACMRCAAKLGTGIEPIAS
ncbi:hypothetical protein PsaNZ64_00405 [Pseudomonas syringae pv. actinidiae]|uniref:hypothetical protein n=1 Tax=Pseudomonas syringae group TaxID=136849 RepID=UPI0006B9C2CF|nr:MULTISPECIES: hypothetical protein [Pseudomonas syringae group]KPB36947.1 Uncharacterized protein AC516_4008 [Pseudomonas amygdali pv. sesami]OKS78777.1 hypothetical protein PsaNZ64_00405 [Pseudomonas syringae pv. actinidiae]